MTIRLDTRLKRSAQQIAKDLGFTVSALVHGYLKQLVKTRTVHFSDAEEPSEYLIRAIKEAEAERKAGKYKSFDNPKEAIAFLDRIIGSNKRRAS